jgi:rare lipoprotein A
LHETARASNSARRVAEPGGGSRGLASFYSGRSATGEQVGSNVLTAAHRTLPFGTKVRVTNLSNGQSVTVRINDRGPFVRNRSIDLSDGAAGAIGMKRAGVAPVRMEVIR